MKRLLIVVCALLLPLSVYAQRIESVQPDMGDLMDLLNTAGYDLYSFDIKGLMKENQTLMVESREYEEGEQISRRVYEDGQNIHYDAEKINIGFFPAKNDSTRIMHISVEGSWKQPRGVTFKLRGLKIADYPDRTYYHYGTRVFESGEAKENEFSPLVLLGSHFYAGEMIRFCGVPTDLSSDVLKRLPHYYVIGITLIQKTEN